MALFEKLVKLQPLRPYMEMADEIFIEEVGWRDVLGKIKELKQTENVVKVIREAAPQQEKEKLILGYLCTMAAEGADGPVELPCVAYGGCFLSRGALKLKGSSKANYPDYVGMGMKALRQDTKILVEGNVGDYLGYRSPRLNMEVRGSVRDNVGMAAGDGKLRIQGNIAGGLGGHAQNVRIEVVGSVGSINGENTGCTFLIEENVQGEIAGDQAGCFIKVAGSVGLEYKNKKERLDVAPGMTKNAMLLIGGNVYGNLGKGLGVGRIFVWGRVYGEIQTMGIEGGYIYLNRKSTPVFERMRNFIGGDISVKYVALKESGYLFAEGPDDIKEIVLA